MKQAVFAAASVLCCLFLAACVVVESEDFEVSEPDEAELKRSVELGNNILASFRDEDYARLVRNIPGPLRSKMTEKDFKTSCGNWRDTLGRIRDYEYEFELETPAVRNLVWKVEFERDGSGGKPVKQDMLFRLVTGNVDGETEVLSCGFL